MNPLLGLLGFGASPAQPSPFAPPASGRGGMMGGMPVLKPAPVPPGITPGPFGYTNRQRRQVQKLPPVSPLGPGGALASKLGLGGL